MPYRFGFRRQSYEMSARMHGIYAEPEREALETGWSFCNLMCRY
ncbi:hypothetical protein [Lentimicrobium saccharophilum]|nr:hypothetical protein [Lentimicrobium saccharophilum]